MPENRTGARADGSLAPGQGVMELDANPQRQISCLFEDHLGGHSLRLLDPVARIAVHQRTELPAAWEAIEAARCAGHWVALLLDYELGEWLEESALAHGLGDAGIASTSGAPLPPPRLTALVFARAEQGTLPPAPATKAHDHPRERASAPQGAVARPTGPPTHPEPTTAAAAASGAPLQSQGQPDRSADPRRLGDPGPVLRAEPGVSRAAHAQAIKAIRAGIEHGDFYQINYTLPLHLDWPASLDPAQVYAQLASHHPVAHAACIQDGERWILSLSPELFVARNGTRLQTRPMKGTAPRHTDPTLDQQAARELQHSSKNQAENLMIVDLLRNDLGRIATPGSVRVPALFSLEAYPSVWTLTSTVEAEAPGVALPEVLRALFPCGSITGAPKIAAMHAIRTLEHRARGIYCGSVGWLAPNGDFSLNVAIRTVELRNGQAQFGVGGGIVHDSRAGQEWEECLWKARMLQPTFTLPQPQSGAGTSLTEAAGQPAGGTPHAQRCTS